MPIHTAPLRASVCIVLCSAAGSHRLARGGGSATANHHGRGWEGLQGRVVTLQGGRTYEARVLQRAHAALRKVALSHVAATSTTLRVDNGKHRSHMAAHGRPHRSTQLRGHGRGPAESSCAQPSPPPRERNLVQGARPGCAPPLSQPYWWQRMPQVCRLHCRAQFRPLYSPVKSALTRCETQGHRRATRTRRRRMAAQTQPTSVSCSVAVVLSSPLCRRHKDADHRYRGAKQGGGCSPIVAWWHLHASTTPPAKRPPHDSLPTRRGANADSAMSIGARLPQRAAT
jgi:hypothetical protein